ncbi:hypothetical protein EDB19DRAFT_1906938 [Suillus lakei]|nr:hypothetical protein EDB19DRAFT_1906938 [Suillus lakei]
MSESLYSSCAEVLFVCQATKDVLAALLDPNMGFAPRLRQLYRDQITEAENSTSSDVSPEELDVLHMEANTGTTSFCHCSAGHPFRYRAPVTSFEDGTHDTALEQATVILRYFLGAGRVSLAKNLVEMLPRELASIDRPEERAT